jgi:hypothetical protein
VLRKLILHIFSNQGSSNEEVLKRDDSANDSQKDIEFSHEDVNFISLYENAVSVLEK